MAEHHKYNLINNIIKKSGFDGSQFLAHDVNLLENTLEIGFFDYGPRLWMLEEVGPLKLLKQKSKRKTVINKKR